MTRLLALLLFLIACGQPTVSPVPSSQATIASISSHCQPCAKRWYVDSGLYKVRVIECPTCGREAWEPISHGS